MTKTTIKKLIGNNNEDNLSMFVKLEIKNNSGTIVFNNYHEYDLLDSNIVVEQAYIYCSNAFAINAPPHVEFDLVSNVSLTNTRVDYDFFFPTDSVASNVLKLSCPVMIGVYGKKKLIKIRYNIYDNNFSNLGGAILMKVLLRFDRK